MKYLSIILFAFFGFSVNVNAQEDAISKYFDQYVDDEDFSIVYISSKMFELLGKLDVDDLEDKETEAVMEVVKDMRGLRVLTTEINSMSFYKEALAKINTKEGYEQLMTVRTDDEKVQFLVKEDADVIRELLLLVGSPDDFTMVSFIGNIHLNSISKLAKVLDVEGAEHLEKLEEEEKKEKKRTVTN